MMQDPYLMLVKRAYQELETGDLDLLRVVMADDVVWHEAGESLLAGDYTGPEAVLGLLGQLKKESGGTFRMEVLDVLSEPERALVVERETATKDGRLLDDIAIVDFEIHRGRITEATIFHGDMYKFDEFWRSRSA